METCKAWKVGDQTFTDELAALKYEYALEIRGVYNRDTLLGKATQFSGTDSAKCITRHDEEIAKIIQKYRNKIRGFQNRKSKIASVAA